MKILSPVGTVFPYHSKAKEYLLAGPDANVSDYKADLDNQAAPIVVEWEACKGATVYEVECRTLMQGEPAFCGKVGYDVTKIELFNLYKGAEYIIRVTAYNGGGALEGAESSFFTTDIGPRVMCFDGIFNTRDLGGYITDGGRATRQGVVYRGGSLTPADIYTPRLTEQGKGIMRDVAKIKTELDLRNEKEAGIAEGESLIPGAVLRYINIGAYGDASTFENYRALFAFLADPENYPVYIHCTGGADRTGTAAFLINALLGVDERELIQDYEFTSFSVFGERNTRQGVYSELFAPFRKMLEEQKGDTLKEKAESFLLSLGVTEAEINSLRAIMLGDN